MTDAQDFGDIRENFLISGEERKECGGNGYLTCGG